MFVVSLLLPRISQADAGYPYTAECSVYGLKRPKPAPEKDAASQIAARARYENEGMALHSKSKWKESNCLLIHALNISTDHAANLINMVGFNYAALGNDGEALRYFAEATAFSFDLDTWVQYKKKVPFKKVLTKPIYQNHETLLVRYYKDMGLPIPK